MCEGVGILRVCSRGPEAKKRQVKREEGERRGRQAMAEPSNGSYSCRKNDPLTRTSCCRTAIPHSAAPQRCSRSGARAAGEGGHTHPYSSTGGGSAGVQYQAPSPHGPHQMECLWVGY